MAVDLGRDYWENTPFGGRNYGVFGFLADVRNYSGVPPIAPQRGIPADCSPEVRAAWDDWAGDAHSASWVTVAELDAVDYDAPMEDRRVTRQMPGGWYDGGCTADPGEGEVVALRDFLGASFLADVAALRALGDPTSRPCAPWAILR